MCVAVPMEIKETRSDRRALAALNGAETEVDTTLLDVRRGDWVLVHAGCALQKMSAEEAKISLDVFEELGL